MFLSMKRKAVMTVVGLFALACVAGLSFAGCADKGALSGKFCYTDPTTGNQVCVGSDQSAAVLPIMAAPTPLP